MRNRYKRTVDFIREQYSCKDGFIPLHAPVFQGNEKKYLNECIDSTFVSSVGMFVDRFEQMVADFTGADPVFLDSDAKNFSVIKMKMLFRLKIVW